MEKLLIIFAFMVVFSCESYATSMYSESNYVSLVSDKVARNIGDGVTVLIYESASASASNNTETNRKTDVKVGVVDANQNPDNRSIGIDSNFNGGGDLNRTGNLLAKITARIKEIDDNGEMLIEGQQFIELNDDKQTITLSGRIRKEDIGPNNTVVSTRLSDAKIKYLTEGTLADRQKPGWITRFFDWIF
jgi:flagellar L-ring protein FlgH